MGHIRADKFSKNPKALATTVLTLEEFVGNDIMRILHEYPINELAAQAIEDGRRNLETRQLIDRLVLLMKGYKMAVNAANLYLCIDEPRNAKGVLEEAISHSDVMAFRERIIKEVDDGRFGRPRYVEGSQSVAQYIMHSEPVSGNERDGTIPAAMPVG